MYKDFLNLLMDKIELPKEAKAEILGCYDTVTEKYAKKFSELLKKYEADKFIVTNLLDEIEELSKNISYHKFTLIILMVMCSAKNVYKKFYELGISEEIVWDTFRDIKYKVIECYELYGVWGTFVANWFRFLLSLEMFKLGRLEYTDSTYQLYTPYKCGDINLEKDTTEYLIKAVHIPSSAEPFDKQARLDSYKKAYEFFKDELKGRPLVLVCFSWLLYGEYKSILPPTSNIIDFMGDFDVVESRSSEIFEDAWRIFGCEEIKNIETLPEKTSLQRIFKQHLLNGGTVGEGYGVLIFDGEKILNKKEF